MLIIFIMYYLPGVIKENRGHSLKRKTCKIYLSFDLKFFAERITNKHRAIYVSISLYYDNI
jgi:hypothetical protein